MSEEIIFFGVIGAVTLGAIIFVLARMPRGSVAAVAVEPGVPFELCCSPANSKEHRVCLDYSLFVPGMDPDLFGIACASPPLTT